MNIVFALAAVAAVVSAPVFAAELVVNGDFESGNSGFTSDYLLASSQGYGTFAIATSPQSAPNAYTDWDTFGDHTTGQGLMLLADSAVTANQSVWKQSLSLVAGQTYDFSFWARQVLPSSRSDPALIFLVDGLQQGGVLTLHSSSSFGWEQSTGSFVAASTGMFEVAIRNQNSSGPWNDFALDDISVTNTVPEPATWALLISGFGLTGLAMRRRRKSETAID